MARAHPLAGKPAPSLSLPDANGETYTLEPSNVGKPVVIFFYPKSGEFVLRSTHMHVERTCSSVIGTYGCTKEACEFRDALAGMVPGCFEDECWTHGIWKRRSLSRRPKHKL